MSGPSTPPIENQTAFPNGQLDVVMSHAASLLLEQDAELAVFILANTSGRLNLWDSSQNDQNIWRLTLSVPADIYFKLDDKKELENEIASALTTVSQSMSEEDFFDVRIDASLVEEPNWRDRINELLHSRKKRPSLEWSNAPCVLVQSPRTA